MDLLSRCLMLVACLPLLQPTGTCICRGGELRFSKTSAKTTACPHLQHVSSKICCRQCSKTEQVQHSTSNLQTTKSKDPTPNPTDEQHLPGCPASTGADGLKWIEPTTMTAVFSSIPVIHAWIMVLTIPSVTRSCQPHLLIPPHRTPHGLINCVLVI